MPSLLRSDGCPRSDAISLYDRCKATYDRPFIVLLEQFRGDQLKIASSLGKMPTTSVRRLTSPVSRSRPLVEGSFDE